MDGTGADGRTHPQPLTAPLGTLGPTTPKPDKSLKHLAGDADNEYAMLDSTVVRAHQHSAGAVKKGVATRRSGAAAAA
jgi:hypothetical protein